MKDYESRPPLKVSVTEGSYLTLSDGSNVIDATSSWWCKSLGHRHPKVVSAIKHQLDHCGHALLGNTTNTAIEQLSEKLCQLSPSLNKVLYASDGSCAVETALKLSLHTRQIQGDHKRSQFITLQNSYHGETIGAMSVSDTALYSKPYQSILFHSHIITSLPYVNTKNDPLWSDCSDYWQNIEPHLSAIADSVTAIIVEPIVQGAGGMKIYSQDFLTRIAYWAKQNNIHLIADEIMTGIGRTGTMLACEHAAIEADFVCLAKGLTSGCLPLSVALTTDVIYDHFYDDYASGKTFLHSHTHSGNTLAASAALAVLDVIESQQLCQRAQQLEHIMLESMNRIAAHTNKLHHVRGIGAIVAADIINEQQIPRLGYHICQKATELGALLRPLGDTIYWCPPLTIEDAILSKLAEITRKAIEKT